MRKHNQQARQVTCTHRNICEDSCMHTIYTVATEQTDGDSHGKHTHTHILPHTSTHIKHVSRVGLLEMLWLVPAMPDRLLWRSFCTVLLSNTATEVSASVQELNFVFQLRPVVLFKDEVIGKKKKKVAGHHLKYLWYEVDNWGFSFYTKVFHLDIKVSLSCWGFFHTKRH